MSTLGWWALSTFVAALAIPIFWLPFMALMLVMGNNWLRAAQQPKPGPKRSQYQRIPATVPDHKKLRSEERKSSSQVGSTTVIGMQVDGDEENGISISISETYCEEANPESRSKAYRDHVENVLSREGFYRLTPEKYYANAERIAELIVLPPEEWRIQRNMEGKVVVDAEWKWSLGAKSEAEWQVYLYSVKNHPELVKVGIAKDVLKRKERYYSCCLKKWKVTKREAILVEALFKHATYGLHSSEPPRYNVSNLQRETVHPQIEALWTEFEDCNGFSEIRQMTKEMAVQTIEQIRQDVLWRLTVDKLLLKYGITTFHDAPTNSFRSEIEVPALMWQLRPHDGQKANPDDFAHLDEEIAESLMEDLLAEEAEMRAKCWEPEAFSAS